jgi:hypothetical protein
MMRAMKAAAWTIAAALVVVAVASLWVAGEARYRNCLSAVDLRYPVAYQQPTDKTDVQFEIGPQPEFVFHERVRRTEALNECSRWPL